MHRSVTTAIGWLFAVVQISTLAGVARAETKVACVGDSITALPTSWCGDLSTKLGAGYTVSNFGVSGTNLLKDIAQPYWDSTEYGPSHDFAPNIVIIMLGTNDSIPSTWAGKDHFVADYEDLIDSYTSLASHPMVYLILPTPIGESPFGHSGDLLADEVVPMVKQVAMNKGVPAIDAFTAFGGKDFDPGLYGDLDQVHPNDKGQQIICDLVYAALMSSDDPGDAGTGGSPGSGGSASPGSGGTSGSVGTGGSGNAGSGGVAGGSMGTGGAGGSAGSMNASGAGGGGAANTGGSASLAGAGGSANTGGNSSMGNATAAAGTSAPPASAAEGSGGGCRTAGNSTNQTGPAAVLLVLFAMAIRRRKRNVSVVQLFVVVQVFIAAGVANAQGMKVACVGDSITAIEPGWCSYLGTKLGAGYTAQGFGVSGTTLLKDVGQPAYSSSDQYQPSHDFAPNIVVIMLGTNDSASRNWDAGKDHFVADYEELIDSYTSLASKPMVFLNTPPPASDDNMFTISGTTIEKEINPLIKQVAMTKMCPLVDVWAAFDGDVEKIGSFDGVHPGDAGQMTIAETVYQAIKSPNIPGADAGSGGSAGSGNAGSGGMAGGNVGTGGSGNAGSGGKTGGSVGSGGAGGAAGTMNTSGAGGGSANTAGNANTGGSASLAGVGGSANTGGNSGMVNAMAAAGTSAPVDSAPESSAGGCRAAGNSTNKAGPSAVLLALFAIAIRSRKRNGPTGEV